MPPPFPGGESMVLRRIVPALVGGQRQYDDYGVLITKAVEQTITGVVIYPNSSSEAMQNVERSRSGYTVLLPTTVTIDAVDRIVWRGKEYDVEGEAERFQSPFTTTTLQTLIMYRVEG